MNTTERTRRLLSFALALALLVGCGCGCSRDRSAEQPSPSAPAPTGGAPAPTASADAGGLGLMNLSFSPDFNKAGEVYEPVEVTPRVAGYTVSADLSNIVNLDQFPNLTAEQKEKLVRNGFVVAPGGQEQLFYVYEDNTYKKIPNFVTTDSVLQVYHIFYDYALRSVESLSLFQNAVTLSGNMLGQLIKEYGAITDPAVKPEALKVLGYFGVAQLAFGETLPDGFPEEVRPLVESELKLVRAAGGREESPLFGYEIDYSLFTVRGHYTRSEELAKYFLGMSWYGVVPFPLYLSDGETPDTQSAVRAIIAATALCRLPGADGGALWENIYSTTSFFVGASDDLTPYQLAEVIEKVYGSSPDLNELADESKLGEFYEQAKSLPQPQIVAKVDQALASGADIRTGPQLRFMGQRYIPDSEILQELCDPIARPFPTGLDVFASLGSERAADIVADVYKPAEVWPKYIENFLKMKTKFTSLTEETWRSNMYYGWLWTQKSLTGEYGEGYPMFMRSTAWQDKSLSTALASWAEMRHDTILYAKATVAECGGFDQPPVVRAYVEPNPELFNRLLWLTSFMRKNLTARGILPEKIEYACENFEAMLKFLRDCSVKELEGEDLTAEEYDSLLTYGGTLEHLTSSSTENGVKWYQIESETDRNMAVVADVHTVYPNSYLEEGVGTAAEIYVAVPMGGQIYLTRGAVFDYFEFVSQERLTDEAWQAMLKTQTPGRPPFTSSYIAGEAHEVPAPAEPYTTGC